MMVAMPRSSEVSEAFQAKGAAAVPEALAQPAVYQKMLKLLKRIQAMFPTAVRTMTRVAQAEAAVQGAQALFQAAAEAAAISKIQAQPTVRNQMRATVLQAQAEAAVQEAQPVSIAVRMLPMLIQAQGMAVRMMLKPAEAAALQTAVRMVRMLSIQMALQEAQEAQAEPAVQ